MSLDELWDRVRRIPRGRVMSYGELGRCLSTPATGRMVGRWMAQSPEDLPWWRVIGQDGRLPIGKRDPRLERDQRNLLNEEGVALLEDRVHPEAFWTPDEGESG